MYQLDPEHPHYEQIGERGRQQPYNAVYLQTLQSISLKFSSEIKQIQHQFHDDGIIASVHWKGYDWVMLCIAYCFAKDIPTEQWDDPDQKGIEIKIDTLFQSHLPFWTAYISEKMFQSRPTKDDWTSEDFSRWVRALAHNGALALKKRWEETLQYHNDVVYKARSEFLTELAGMAYKNMPKHVVLTPNDTQPVPSNDLSERLKEILQRCKIPAERVELSSSGVRYDVYEVQFPNAVDLERKTDDIAQHLGKTENAVIAGGIVQGKSLTQLLKILRPEDQWRSFGQAEFQNALQQHSKNYELPVCIGLNEDGNPVFRDFHDAPHAIVGGTTGSGKSVAVRAMLRSLLELTPQDKLDVVILDPKKLDYREIHKQYTNIHLITETGEMLAQLHQLAKEMDERYFQLEELDAKTISDIPDGERPFCFKVVIVDEVADLFMTNKEVAEPLTRLAQKARAVGIHLLLSTQRPEVKVLGEFGGILRSNLPTKIALKVDKKANSLIILDEEGAEKLVGKGDRFVKWNGGSKMFLHGYNI